MAKRKIVLVRMKLVIPRVCLPSLLGKSIRTQNSFHIYLACRTRLGVPLWEVLSMVSEQCRVLVVKLQCQPLAVHFRVHIMGGCCLVED